MILGVVVVFPVVVTFGVAGVLAAVQGFFPWSSPSALIRRANSHRR